MARLYLSMSGEGRGHAGRALALIEQLRKRHELTVFAPTEAYRMLSPYAKQYGIAVHEIPGITNRYRGDESLDAVATALATRHYLKRFPALVQRLCAQMRTERPDLAISDFEPALPRAARRCGTPWLSVDHQHWLVVGDLTALPPSLRWQARWISALVRGICPPSPTMVVSSFYHLPLKPKYRHVEQVGVLLRESMRALPASSGEHVLAYFRRHAPERVLEALERCGHPVRVYGNGERATRGNFRFMPFDSDQFAADLASCRALVTTAGNQLVGEAMYFRKPVLAMAEPGNPEQLLNAHFVTRSGAGIALDVERCDPLRVRGFLARLDGFAPDPRACDGGGTARAVALIERVLCGETSCANDRGQEVA